ncbi:chemotaxis protein CheW [Neptunomonas japonica]|uniref:Chemotaxis protein CheW n=1 Tax=Neptunomonas japonica JAMM 1380 TaxID=1441457 RepID=A0A7R6PWX6_9GAMM|nr:chemotaxis protein CheW [Neptunomonas japonica]BBB31048.1 purine-binding chemotaxis protein CheW [Neptunomonas japonica JAMM 1380]
MTEIVEPLLLKMRQFLTFILADEEYGVDILRVQEIRGWVPVTRIPNSPDYMKGVLNLRGEIIPIIDLRIRFGFPSLEYGATTVVIVVWVHGPESEHCMGVVVDAVADTYDVSSDDIQSAPLIRNGIDPQYFEALATMNEKMVVLLDLDYLMNSGEQSGADLD